MSPSWFLLRFWSLLRGSYIRDDLTPLVVGAGILRLVLVGFAIVQDFWAQVPYTDVDYQVFTEAAESVLLGLSPYSERTPLLSHPMTKYRYSPLLAYMLLPNHLLHPAWGKVLFSALDLVAAGMLARWLRAHSGGNKTLVWQGVAIWLFNPLTLQVSTRGSCESFTVVLLYGVFDMLCMRRNIPVAAVLFGTAVHWRVYPIIYSLPLAMVAGRIDSNGSLRNLFNSGTVTFLGTSGFVFLSLLYFFTVVYGSDFVNIVYLHHGARVDTQHNFSVYFYPLRWFPGLAKLSILPQFLCVLVLGIGARGPEVSRVVLLQTLMFVALNKVITAQYFVWWFALLPPALPWLRVDGRLLWSLVLWFVAEVHWLVWGYLLEFQKLEVPHFVWLASCVFLAAELHLVWALRRSPVVRK